MEPEQQESVMQIVTSWMEKGKQQEAASLALRLLSRRLGAVDACPASPDSAALG